MGVMAVFLTLGRVLAVLYWWFTSAKDRTISVNPAPHESSWTDQAASHAGEAVSTSSPQGKGGKGAAGRKSTESPTEISGIKHDELTCSRCLWSSRAFRAALAEKGGR